MPLPWHVHTCCGAPLPYRWDEAFECDTGAYDIREVKGSLAKHEEGLLVARLGDDYEEYRCRLC